MVEVDGVNFEINVLSSVRDRNKDKFWALFLIITCFWMLLVGNRSGILVYFIRWVFWEYVFNLINGLCLMSLIMGNKGWKLLFWGEFLFNMWFNVVEILVSFVF